jgi:TraM recognition site of TraD and TraG
MDFLLDRLESSARELNYRDRHQLKKYIEGFREPGLRTRPSKIGTTWKQHLQPLVIGALNKIMERDGLVPRAPNAYRGFTKGSFEKDYKIGEGILPRAQFPLTDVKLSYVVEFRFEDSTLFLRANADLPSWTGDLERRIRDELRGTPEPPEPSRTGSSEAGSVKPPSKPDAPKPGAEPMHVVEKALVLPPGRMLASAFEEDLKDYSGCAREDEVLDLKQKAASGSERVLPLGRYYRFPNAPAPASPAPLLFLPGTVAPPPSDNARRHPDETPALYRGALVVAPQDSGKTMLILRWARAANRCGYSQFIVDVKGNLYQKLQEKGLTGKVYHFTTEPGAASDRLNFLAGLGTPQEPRLDWQIRQLASAILPSEGFEEGEQRYFLQNRTNWLCALIHILKLSEYYWPKWYPGRTADLSDLYDLISNPDVLVETIKTMIAYQQSGKAPADVYGGARRWLLSAALLFSKEEITGGQRSPQHSYQEYVQGLLTPLTSFAKGGILQHKIRDIAAGDGKAFRLEELNGNEPVTIIMTAREQELDDAVTVSSMAVKRLQQILFDRVGARQRPMLLLLDETRRIRSFRPGQYITFAREAQAGCVIVYQSLDQIEDEAEKTEILENVGTQIYLKSIVGNSAKRLIEFLPKRYRRSFSLAKSRTIAGDMSDTWTEQQELIDYFSTRDLYRLPSGPRSALVYLNDHRSGKPFLVEMDEEKIPALA